MPNLKTFVKNIVEEMIKTKYAHLKRPAAMEAEITKIEMADKNNGVYSYAIRILDNNGKRNDSIPEIPGIKCDNPYDLGERVTVIDLYGLMQPFIVGKRII